MGKTIRSSKLFMGLIDVFVNGEIATEGGKKLMGLHYSPEVESFAINLYAQLALAYKYMAEKV